MPQVPLEPQPHPSGDSPLAMQVDEAEEGHDTTAPALWGSLSVTGPSSTSINANVGGNMEFNFVNSPSVQSRPAPGTNAGWDTWLEGIGRFC